MKTLKETEKEPLIELMKLIGLKEVKELSLSMFEDNLADKLLKDKGFQKSVKTKALNFTFVGNPRNW